MSIIFPQFLKKGDKIAIVSPAGAVEKHQILETIHLIESKGYEVVLAPHCLGKYEQGYLYAGTEAERISDLNWAFNNQETSAIWATRGGYGCQHLLEHLQTSQFLKNPKWYIGYSDNTAVQSFLFNKGIASIHGQTLKTSSFGVSEQSYQNIFDILEGNIKKSYQLDAHLYNQDGIAEGILVGGNLSLLYALLGSPFSFNFQDKILFIEDIGENFYALDRMLMSLDLAGIFKQIKGIIVGGMNNMGNEKDNPNYEESYDPLAYQIITHRLQEYNFPKLFGFPNGHIYDNQPLIIGSNINIKITKNQSVIKLI